MLRVRSLTCPNCGGRTRIDHGEQEAQCIHCAQPVRLSQAVLEEQQRAHLFPHLTPLRLGMKAQLHGREYEACGRQVSRQSEEGDVYTWEEWVLVAPDGHMLFLEFDEGKWKVSEPFVPTTHLGAAQLAAADVGSRIPVGGRIAIVTASGTYQVAHAEGEFPWIIVPGKSVSYLDATDASEFYSIERTEDAIECYRGRYVDERQVYSMFGLQHLTAELDRRLLLLQSRKVFGGLCLAAALVTLVLWGVAMASGRPVPNGSGTVLLAGAGAEGVRFGPVQLQAANRVHRLEVRGFMRERSVWVAAVLEDENEQELISADRDMWDESGYDSDGYWHESNLNASSDFVLRKPGSYYVRLYAEPEAGQTVPSDVQASFVLKEKAIFPPYLAFFGFGTLVVGIISLLAGSPSTVESMKQSLQSDDD
jgi:hypothetical protein